MAKSTYTVRFSRSVVSTARVTVEANSKNEALYLAGKQELEWKDEPGEAEIDKVEAEPESAPLTAAASADPLDLPAHLDRRVPRRAESA